MRKPSGKSNTTLQMWVLVIVCMGGGLAYLYYYCSGLKPALHQEGSGGGVIEDLNRKLGLCFALGENVVLKQKVSNTGGGFKGLKIVVSGAVLKLLGTPSSAESKVVIGESTVHPNFVQKADTFEAEIRDVDFPLLGQFSYVIALPTRADGYGEVAVNVTPLNDSNAGDVHMFGTVEIRSNRPRIRMEDIKIQPLPIPYKGN